jgi:hypothetical protein
VTPIVSADQWHREQVLAAGLNAFIHLRGVRALRFIFPSQSEELESCQRLIPQIPLRISFKRVTNHALLEVPETYDGFLRNLGRETRYNYRRYRRHFEATGSQYVSRMSLGDLETAAAELRNKSRIATDWEAFSRALRMLRIANEPVIAGLRDRTGKWLSILTGWYETNRVVLFAQLNNDLDYPHSSLSVVLRGYVIETLIGQHIRNLIFWAGAGALNSYTEPIEATAIYVDNENFGWRLLCSAYRRLRPKLSPGLRALTDWIAAPL